MYCYVFKMKGHDGFHRWFSDVPKCAIFKAKFYVVNNYRSLKSKVFETTEQRVLLALLQDSNIDICLSRSFQKDLR